MITSINRIPSVLIAGFAIAVILWALSSCGSARAGKPSSVNEVYGAPSGLRCFEFRDGDDRPFGGNCLKD